VPSFLLIRSTARASSDRASRESAGTHPDRATRGASAAEPRADAAAEMAPCADAAVEAELTGADAALFEATYGEPAFAPQRAAFPLGPVLDQCCGGYMTLLFAPFSRADIDRLQAAAAAAAAARDRRGRVELWPGGPVHAEPPKPRPVFV
jgi:hypothetical protein